MTMVTLVATRRAEWIALVVVVALTGCNSQETKPPSANLDAIATSFVAMEKEVCLDTPGLNNVAAKAGSPTALFYPTDFTTDVSEVHEHHDCQQLITRIAGTLTFGPLVGIFVPKALDGGNFDHHFDDAEPRLAAVIVNVGGGKYDPMMIPDSASCLRLKHKDGTWSAYIAPATHNMATNKLECDDRSSASLGTYSVIDTTYAGLVPPVADWAWNEKDGYNHIGVRCGDKTWCEIGPPGFKQAESITEGNAVLMKGTYDEQYLAKQGNGKMEVSNVFGTIMPGADLGNVSSKPGKWFKAALIKLEARSGDTTDLAGYAAKFDTHLSAAGRVIRFPIGISQAQSGSDIWNVSTSETGAQSSKLHGKHTKHQKLTLKIPNVRWMWDPTDEKAWMYCDDGCCQVR